MATITEVAERAQVSTATVSNVIRGAEDAAFERGYFLLTANTYEQTGRERLRDSTARRVKETGPSPSG